MIMRQTIFLAFLIFFTQVSIAQKINQALPAKPVSNSTVQKIETWDGKVQGIVVNFKATCKKCGTEVELADMKGHPAVCKGKPDVTTDLAKSKSITSPSWVCHCCYSDEGTKGHKIPCKYCKDNLGISKNVPSSEYKNWTCVLCGKSFGDLSEIERHIDSELEVPKSPSRVISNGINTDGYQCGCCNVVGTAEQIIKHGSKCCTKKDQAGNINFQTSDGWPSSYVCKGCGGVYRYDDKTHNRTTCGKSKIAENLAAKKTNCPPPCEWDTLVPEPTLARGATFPYICNCCNKTLEYTSGTAAVAHKNECCPKPAPTGTVTTGIKAANGTESYTCSTCKEPIPGGASGLAKHEAEAHNLFAITDGFFNGKKVLLAIDELKLQINPLLPSGAELSSAYIKNNKASGEIDLVAYMCIRGDGKLVYCNNFFSLPLIQENGFLKLSFSKLETKSNNQKLLQQTKQSFYIGHVTLLR